MTLLDESITSDKDYLKIFDDGELLISANGTPDADSTFPNDMDAPFGYAGFQLVDHNLGYVPLVRAFYQTDGKWWNTYNYVNSGGFAQKVDPWLKFIVTDTQLKLIMNTDDGSPVNDIPVFYRIYDLNDKTAFDSDTRVDKIFMKDITSGQVAGVGSPFDTGETILVIPHNSNEAPLFSIQFSENQTDWYGEGNQIIGPYDLTSGPPGGPYSRYYYTTAFAAVDNDNLYIYLQSNYSTPKTIYVRYELDYRK